MLSETVLESIGLSRTKEDPWVSVFLKDGSMIFGRCISIPSDYEDEWIALDHYTTSGGTFDDKGGKKDLWYIKESNENNKNARTHFIAVHSSEIIAIAKHGDIMDSVK